MALEPGRRLEFLVSKVDFSVKDGQIRGAPKEMDDHIGER